MTEQQACTLCGADGHRAYSCPMRVEEHQPVLVPWSVLDRAVMWVEDRRRYGDDGTIVDDWLALKSIQRAALAQPSPAPELERPEVVGYLLAKGNGTLSIWNAGPNDAPLIRLADFDRIVEALRAERDMWMQAAGRSREEVIAYIAERANLLEQVAQAGQVPEGWKLVPIEPTKEMMLNGSSCQHHEHDDTACIQRQSRRGIWSKMLAAAPAQGGE